MDLSPVRESPMREGQDFESNISVSNLDSESDVGAWQMIKRIGVMWMQLTLTITIALMIESCNVIMIGHLNEPTTLAAVGLGNMMINMFCIATITGMNSALEILVAQAVGARQYNLAG
jgi:Na+-driven multidrug efflux pump